MRFACSDAAGPIAQVCTQRRRRRRHALTVFLLFCLPWIEAPADDANAIASDDLLVTQVRINGERIEYRGLITEEATAAVIDLYAAAQPRPTSFWIQSEGGDADPAMRLGLWLADRRLDVEVDTFCFSSCANYVFPAGRKKFLSPHAALMWHGGATQPVTAEQLEQVLDRMLADMPDDERRDLLAARPRAALLQQLQSSLLDLTGRETRFFATIGVDQRITRLGHLYERELLKGEGRYLGWDYSLEDLARLGVRNVQVKGNASWAPVCPIPGQEIYRLRLQDLPQFQPRIPAPPAAAGMSAP